MKQTVNGFWILAIVLCVSIISACSSADKNGNSNSGVAASTAQAQTAAEANQTNAEVLKKEKQTDIFAAFKKGDDYKSSVRVKMLKDGWKPAPTEDSEKCGSGDSRCDEYPEMESCAGTGLGNCKFLWSKGEKVVAIFTVGEPYIFQSYEFETPVKSSATTNLIGRYIYSSKHEYGTDRFIYDLKNNNVAAYTSETEGNSGEDKTGAWSWNEASKSLTITFPPQKKDESKDVYEDVPEETFVFKLEGKNLKMIKEPKRGASYVGFTGVIFKKS